MRFFSYNKRELFIRNRNKKERRLRSNNIPYFCEKPFWTEKQFLLSCFFKKNKDRQNPSLFSYECWFLLRLRSIHRANIGAVAAVDAGVRVDYVNVVALSDRFHGAFACACAAADAFVGNLICHDAFLRIKISLTL
jgi:hypothetical protein